MPIFIIVLFLTIFFQFPTMAYIGPGMGGGVILATIGIVVAIVAAIFGIIWFPLKRFFKRKQKKKDIDHNL